MATLELIQYVPHRPVVVGDDVVWEIDKSFPPIDGLPQIFWEDYSGPRFQDSDLSCSLS